MTADNTRFGARLAAIAARPASAIAPPIARRLINEGRDEHREKVYRFARLRLPDNGVLNCIVLDLSRGGARVKVDGCAEGLPEYLMLEFEASGVTKRARVAWEREHTVGLQFLDPSQRIFGCRAANKKEPAQNLDAMEIVAG